MPGHLRCTICHLAHSTPQRRESLYFVIKNFDPALYFSKTLTLVCVSQISHIMIFRAWSTSFKVRFNWSWRHIVWQTCCQEDSLSWEVSLQQLPWFNFMSRSSSGLWIGGLCVPNYYDCLRRPGLFQDWKKLSVAWNCSRLPSCDVVGCHRGAIVVPPLPSPRWPPMPSPLPQTSKQRF